MKDNYFNDYVNYIDKSIDKLILINIQNKDK